jgi:hypothetical protein
MTTAPELAALRAEVAALRADVATLLRVAGIFCHAGQDDALHGYSRANDVPASKPPQRGRGKLKLVR